MVKKGVLKCGFKFSINDSHLDDMELLEDLVEIDKGDILKLPAAITKLLGETQKKKLYDKLRDKKTGVVSSTSVGEALQEMFEIMNENDPEDTAKNS